MVVAIFALLALATWLSGCASLKVTVPGSGEVIEAQLGVKGCIALWRNPQTREWGAVVEHDGMSNALAGTLRAIVGSASSVFGGDRDRTPLTEAGEGCASAAAEAVGERRVIGELVEPPTPREALGP